MFLLAVVCDLDLVALTFLTDGSHDDPNCKLYLKLNKYMTAISTVCCCSDQTVYVGKKAKTFSSLLWRATFAFVSVKILDFLTNQIPKLKTWEKILENCWDESSCLQKTRILFFSISLGGGFGLKITRFGPKLLDV